MMHSKLHFYLPFCFLLLTSLSLSKGETGDGDIRALLEFRKGIREDFSSNVLASWSLTSSSSSADAPRDWYGVSCDDTGAVISIALDEIGLSGEVKFATLIGMSSLQSLSLSGNNLTGRIVPTLGSMSTLRHLDLSRNQFYGKIPEKMMELLGINYMNFSFNKFEGTFPDGIGKMEQLRQLDVRSNRIWGDVSSLLSEMRNVDYLDLSENDFYGDLRSLVSEDLSSLGDTMRYINFSHNKLSGGFFLENAMGMFRNLEILDVSNNALIGNLSKLDFGSNMKIFKAANNHFSGSLPEKLFGSQIPLKELDLSQNSFTGSVWSINSSSLNVLNLSSNDLSGGLPLSIGGCMQVDFSRNKLSGKLSAMRNWGSSLEVIDLSSNELSGRLPNVASQFGSLLSIKIRDNSLEGGFPFQSHPRISTIDLSLNKLNGFVPPSLFTSSNLTNLNLSGNHFTGHIVIQIPRSVDSLVLSNYPHLESLDLSNNSLSGHITPDISFFSMLKLLYLQMNSFSGHIPFEISKVDKLESIDLSSNHLSGKIPDFAQSNLKQFNVSYNDLVGIVPHSLRMFLDSSFHPGNPLLIFPTKPNGKSEGSEITGSENHRHHFNSVMVIMLGSIGGALFIFCLFMALYRIKKKESCGRTIFVNQSCGGRKHGVSSLNFLQPHQNSQFSNGHMLNSDVRNITSEKEIVTEPDERVFFERNVGMADVESMKTGMASNNCCPKSGGFKSPPGSPLNSLQEQPVVLSVYSPDRLKGELFYLDTSLVFTAEELSRAPAEVLGRSSHGTSYKATLGDGHALTVKWLRVGLVKRKKEFAKEMKKIGTMRHPNIIPFRAYYWGPREQERLIISDYVNGDSLALHLHESTPRRYSRLTFPQRLKITIDIARCLCYLHQNKGIPHGNLKPTNILLSGPELTARLTDYGLHHLMTLSGTTEQMLNLGALGYRAPELSNAPKPLPSFKADVYAFGVITMELLTRRSAGDIISGQVGAVDLTDWVRTYVREGRGFECFDRYIAGLEEAPRAMDELLKMSLKCILPVNQRPNITTIFEDLSSISS